MADHQVQEDDDLSTLQQVFASTDEMQVEAMPPASSENQIVTLTKVTIEMVVEDICSDASTSEKIRTFLKTMDVGQLYDAMEWLNKCLTTKKGKRHKNPEPVWREYHQVLLVNVASAECREGYSYLALRLLKELVRCNFRYQDESVVVGEMRDLSERDRDILTYIGGYLLRKTSDRNIIAKCSSEIPSGMVKSFDRGGLIMPSEEFVDVMTRMEVSFRQMPTKSVDKQQFQDILESNNVYNCLQEILEDSMSIDLYAKMTSLFFRVRAHQKCRQIFENVVKKGAYKQAKALRSVLSK